MPPSETRLSPKDRRNVLVQLYRYRLGELTSHFELDVTDRRATQAHIDAIVRKRSLDFRLVLELLRREELQAACQVLGLDAAGREKAKLVERILEDGKPQVAAPLEASATSAPSVPPSLARSANGSSLRPPMSARSEGTLRPALRRFVLETAGGHRGRDARATFTSRLLECFGWPESGPPDATMPATLAVVDDWQRATRKVALIWKERRVLLDVVKSDVLLDAAWKDLFRVCLQTDPVPQYVVLTNQRDVRLYDLGRDREAPRLSIPLDALPKYSEAFPFLSPTWSPGTLPKIINVSKVSGEVADLVARLYRSLIEQHPKREREVVQLEVSSSVVVPMLQISAGVFLQIDLVRVVHEAIQDRVGEARVPRSTCATCWSAAG